MIRDILQDLNERMTKAVDSLQYDLKSIRTGRASPVIVERLSIDYYGQATPLMQLASISVPEASQLVIRPFSPGDISAIERAIAISDLGLTPSNDGKQIRLSFPPLTEERRRDLTKGVSRRAEEARVAIRNIRRDAIGDLRSFQKEGLISEDELSSGEKQVQERTDAYVTQVDEVAKEKETEIMTL